jgi:hypothetical protein
VRDTLIKQLLDAEPFRPFTISMSSRTTVRIDRKGQAVLSPDGSALTLLGESGPTCVLSTHHIVSITLDPPPDEPIIAG